MNDLQAGNCGEKLHTEPKEGSPGAPTAQSDLRGPTAAVRTHSAGDRR